MNIDGIMSRPMLDLWDDVNLVSIHSDWRETSFQATQTELSGGNPPYARQFITWNDAVARGNVLTNKRLAQGVLFNIPPGGRVAWFGLWKQIGGFHSLVGMTPNTGPLNPISGAQFHPVPFAVANGDTVVSPNALVVGSHVVFWDSAYVFPRILTDESHQYYSPMMNQGQIYHVVEASPEHFKFSDVTGGAPMTYTLSGSGFWQPIVVVDFPEQAEFRISRLTLLLPGM